MELSVISTKVMRYSEKEALDYLKNKGYTMSRDKYYRTLGHISAETKKRLYEVAKNSTERHMQRIDELATIKEELWNNYRKISNLVEKVKVLKEIKDLQPWVSAYDEATQGIVEDAIKNFGKGEPVVDISSLFQQK